jgi:mono/diheme cytochrome c family protein
MKSSGSGWNCLVLGSVVAVATLTLATVKTGAQQPPKSVWDGVYSEAEAARGKEEYLKNCASCHGDNMQGGDEAPGLAGEGFLSQWVDLTVGDLYERTRITMPQDRPGQLSREEYTLILSHLLKANRYPAGATDLPRDTAALKGIAIIAKPSQ